MSKWIPVHEQMPKDFTVVLIFDRQCGQNVMRMAYYDGSRQQWNSGRDAIMLAYEDKGQSVWRWCNGYIANPTHWMELPEPPTNK